MITLNIGIGEGSIDRMTFDGQEELYYFIESLDFTASVWLISCNADPMPCVFVHEDTMYIRQFAEQVLIGDNFVDDIDEFELHLHQYHSYEDAFKVATEFFEANPLCY